MVMIRTPRHVLRFSFGGLFFPYFPPYFSLLSPPGRISFSPRADAKPRDDTEGDNTKQRRGQTIDGARREELRHWPLECVTIDDRFDLRDDNQMRLVRQIDYQWVLNEYCKYNRYDSSQNDLGNSLGMHRDY